MNPVLSGSAGIPTPATLDWVKHPDSNLNQGRVHTSDQDRLNLVKLMAPRLQISFRYACCGSVGRSRVPCATHLAARPTSFIYLKPALAATFQVLLADQYYSSSVLKLEHDPELSLRFAIIHFTLSPTVGCAHSL